MEIAGIEAITPDFYKNKDLGIVVKAGGAHPFRTIDEIFVANGETVARLDGGHAKFAELLPTMLKDAATITTEDSKLLLEVTGDARPGTMPLFTADGEPRIWDLTLMAYLADPTRTNYGISYLTERFSAPTVPATGDANESAATAKALLTMQSVAQEVLKDNGLWDLYKTIELPLVHTLLVMEKNGIYIDKAALEETQTRFEAEANELRDAIYKEAGEEFNINSPKQLGVILFEKINLPVLKKTKTGYSTNAEVLDMLRNDHPIIELILKYRTVVKLISTYLEGLKR